MGYEVWAFEKGDKAIEMYKTRPDEIDLVITDMIMPELNGREVFFKLKEINENCKILLSSGFTKEEEINDLKENGLSGFIRKPFRVSELSKLLEKVLG